MKHVMRLISKVSKKVIIHKHIEYSRANTSNNCLGDQRCHGHLNCKMAVRKVDSQWPVHRTMSENFTCKKTANAINTFKKFISPITSRVRTPFPSYRTNIAATK